MVEFLPRNRLLVGCERAADLRQHLGRRDRARPPVGVGDLPVQVPVAPVDQPKAALLGVGAGRLDPPLPGPAGAGPHPGQGGMQGDLDLAVQVQVRPFKQAQQAGQILREQVACGWRQR